LRHETSEKKNGPAAPKKEGKEGTRGNSSAGLKGRAQGEKPEFGFWNETVKSRFRLESTSGEGRVRERPEGGTRAA